MRKLTLLFAVFSVFLMACHQKETETEDLVYHFDFQNFELWTLIDKHSTMPADLFPDVDSEILRRMMPSGEAESSINAFLIHKNDKYVLFDAGLGRESGGLMLGELTGLQIAPEDIDVICLTHCHRDHIGGLMDHDTAVFPKAELWVSVPELEAFKEDEMVRKIQAVYGTRIHTFMFGDTIAGFVETFDAAGHTPGHAVYKVDELYIIGDLIHAWGLQIHYPECCAIYDKDPEQAVKTRKCFYKIIENPDVYAAGMHLPYSGVMQSFGIIFSE